MTENPYPSSPNESRPEENFNDGLDEFQFAVFHRGRYRYLKIIIPWSESWNCEVFI